MQQRAQFSGGVLLHRWERVRVDAEGHLDALVPQPLLHDMGGDAGFQQQRRARMTQAVKRDGLEDELEVIDGSGIRRSRIGVTSALRRLIWDCNQSAQQAPESGQG